MKKNHQETKNNRVPVGELPGLDHVPQEKYEGIELTPVWEFVSRFLLTERTDKALLQVALQTWLVNKGFLDRLGKFYNPKMDISLLKPIAAQFLSMQFMREFRDSVLPDFFPNGKFSPEYKNARRMCSTLIVLSKRGWGKQMMFTPQK